MFWSLWIYWKGRKHSCFIWNIAYGNSSLFISLLSVYLCVSLFMLILEYGWLKYYYWMSQKWRWGHLIEQSQIQLFQRILITEMNKKADHLCLPQHAIHSPMNCSHLPLVVLCKIFIPAKQQNFPSHLLQYCSTSSAKVRDCNCTSLNIP